MMTVNVPYEEPRLDAASEQNHTLQYLGVIEVEPTILNQLNEDSFSQDDRNGFVRRSTEQKFIENVEQAQLTGVLPERPTSNTPQVRISISGTGLKIVDATTEAVIERLPLHKIVQAIAYDDTTDPDETSTASNVILVVKRKNFSNRSGDQCHILQAKTPEGAAQVCQKLNFIFDSVKADVSERNSTSS